ncbi:transposase [Streptomyces sp. OE57]|uniref:transposase n=1 Tax=Streptomyces lacaronensis TaxID=3379885 RepID=UPI0039B779B0
MTDVEWAEVRPLLPTPGWMRGRGGRPEGYCHRAVLDAVRYLVDNGVKWRSVPADFPPWDRVYAFFRRWRDHALVKEFHDRALAENVVRPGRRGVHGAPEIDRRSRQNRRSREAGAHRGKMIGRAAATGLPRRNERVRDASPAADDRPGQGR